MKPVRYALLIVVLALLPKVTYSRTLGDGVLDLRTETLAGNSVSLDGLWQFYPNKLLQHDDLNAKDLSSTIRVPSWWYAGETTPQIHYASYRLSVLLSKEDASRKLALKLPPVYTAYSLWVNGKFLGSNGTVGTTEDTSLPQWRPQTYSFYPEGPSLEIIIHVSNFHHHRTGINESLYLGDADKLASQEQQTKLSGTVLLFSLWAFALVSLIYNFLSTKKDPAFIFYAALCIAWSFRSIFSNYYLAIQWFPDFSWTLGVKIEYVTLSLSALFGSLLINRLFPRDISKVFSTVFEIVCGLFVVFTLVMPPSIFTEIVQLYIALGGILLASILVIVTRAYIESRQGISFPIVCMFLAVIMFAYVILAYQGLFELNILLFNGGFFVLFALCGVAVARRLSKMATTFDYDIMTIDQFKLK